MKDLIDRLQHARTVLIVKSHERELDKVAVDVQAIDEAIKEIAALQQRMARLDAALAEFWEGMRYADKMNWLEYDATPEIKEFFKARAGE